MTCSTEAMERKTLFQSRGRELNNLINSEYDFKVEKSLRTIKEAIKDRERPVIASSFGKDSVVLIHMVHQIDNSIPIVFTNTGVNFRETLTYKDMLKEKWNLIIHELKPEKSYWEIVEEYGYPKQSRNSKNGDPREPKCCKILKAHPMKKFSNEYNPDLVFVGLIGDEGRQRRMAYIYKGSANYYNIENQQHKSIPLIWWTSEDIWRYIKENNIPPNPAYEKYNIERTGCIPCTGHIGWEKQLAKLFPGMYRKISHDLGQYLIDDFQFRGEEDNG